MFTQIKTSKENKEVVALLTRKLGLGTENVIARIAYTYSLSQNKKLDLNEIKDAGGKEYSKSVLFGDYYDIYLGLLCVNYGLYKTDKDIARYIKMHVDEGLQLLNEEVNNRSNIDGFDFLTEKINLGLQMIHL
ncbi:DNA sulfur modification protein DndE [Flavobacterium araucananum]|uniref:DNA sulfur modification protein DndE n=1 Tax=Flavobacterium araucananum TaxID=946678 RepID=A0A227PHL8_9FLAO|nr:DndE family protein [Flavobacterium araucananum]OXG08894.1 DNA sulfur modification protein DndE [Flavobacterium araucananum]PWJ97604.1 DNA sulfur modification protein DndE [Flavobacterium araucananum]